MAAPERYSTAGEVRLLFGSVSSSGDGVVVDDRISRILLMARVGLLWRRIDTDSDELFVMRRRPDVRAQQSSFGT